MNQDKIREENQGVKFTVGSFVEPLIYLKLGEVMTRERIDEVFKGLNKVLSKQREELKGKIEKADIAEDKPGSFQDGYYCMKEQVLKLLDEQE